MNSEINSSKSFFSRTINIFSTLHKKDVFIYSALGFLLLFVLVARVHLLPFPFERDEGEYAYMGKLILDGHPPYTMAYNMKLPGTYYMYAIIMYLFGKSIVGVHIGLTIISCASMILVFFISKFFVSKTSALISTASFGILGVSWTLLGQAAHATHFVTFFALLGIYILLRIYKKGNSKLSNYFVTGIFFSFAFICKQSGLFFVFFGFSIIILQEFRLIPIQRLFKKLILLFFGFTVPILMMLLYFYFFGDFEKFWFWTVNYLEKYGSQVPLSKAFGNFIKSIEYLTLYYNPAGYITLWITSLTGVLLLFFTKIPTRNKLIILSFFFLSFLTVVPGFYFRKHYFITLLPAVSLLIAISYEYFNNLFKILCKFSGSQWVTPVGFCFLFGFGVYANWDYLFKQDPAISCKQIYGPNPFFESIEIGEYLKQNTTKEDRIAVLGSEPQICFYADRYLASGYIYTYNLVEKQSYALEMQKEMAKEIELNNPKFILVVNVKYSWLVEPSSEQFIFNWADNYINNGYKLVGHYDIFADRFSSLKIHNHYINSKPQSKELINIYERIDSAD